MLGLGPGGGFPGPTCRSQLTEYVQVLGKAAGEHLIAVMGKYKHRQSQSGLGTCSLASTHPCT